MSSHTPGPWRLSSESPLIIKQDYTHIGLGESSGVLIGSACGHENSGFFPSTEEGLANARLITAAPDLLEALRDIISWIPNEATLARLGFLTEAPELARKKAVAAIAKATALQPVQEANDGR